MKPTVYLAGLMSTEPGALESLRWRERATVLLLDAGFEVRSPVRGKKLLAESKDHGITSVTSTSRDIILRDRRDVRDADVILVHLETWGCSRPMLGTIAELSWAWEQRTPVVAIAFPGNYLMRNHPFIKEFVTHFFDTEREAVDFLADYYRSANPLSSGQ